MAALQIDHVALVPFALAVLLPLLPDRFIAAMRDEQKRERHLPEDVWLDAARVAVRLGFHLGEPTVEAYEHVAILSWTPTDLSCFEVKVLKHEPVVTWWQYHDDAENVITGGQAWDLNQLAQAAIKATEKGNR